MTTAMTNEKSTNTGTTNTRALVTFFVAWAFLVAIITGVVLFIVPQGRIAYWVDWELLGMGKESWANVHIMFGAVFLIGGIVHLYFNWKPFKNYLAGRIGKRRLQASRFGIGREAMTASIIATLMAVAAVADLPPVSWLFDLNATAKGAWVSDPAYEPPYGHAEETSLAGFSKRQNIELDSAMAALVKAGFAVDSPRKSLKHIAESNSTTPLAVYMAIQHLEKKIVVEAGTTYSAETVEATFSGTGVGRKSLAEVVESAGVSLTVARTRLISVGLKAAPEDTLKEIAARADAAPIDVLKYALVANFKP